MTNINNNVKNEVKRYLLGQLGEADEERVELQLLTDATFGEEFDTIVDEITDQYVNGEFQGPECERVQQYFLKSPQRRAKAQFAAALIDRASAPAKPVVQTPTLGERWQAFWSSQRSAFRLATTVAIIVIAVGIAYQIFKDKPTYRNFASLELTMSASDRAEGSQATTLHLAPENDAARIVLHLPEQSNQYKSYQVELINRDGVRRPVEITEQNKQTITVIVPATAVTRGSYALRVSGIKQDGQQEGIAGSYFFKVE
ncbi:MAG TPA: hypothetical protein VJ875_13480 [Pyrinomonadaceae bacterium]|nr:hypothetical protein [Pyrinomonadaceae bacterium]